MDGADRGSDRVAIKITGGRAIVPVSITAVARKEQTWYDFLVKNGVQLSSSDGIYVRTVQSKSERGRPGFGAELDEQVGEFVDKFKKRSRSCTVRLMKRKAVANSKPHSKVDCLQEDRRSVANGGSGENVPWNPPSSLGDGQGGRGISPEMDADVEEDDDDNMSIITTASQDERDLRRNGIQNEDLKSLAARQLDKMDNALLLRARQEIQKLKGANSWVRNYQRAPLACYLIEMILEP